jgi:hypothetical protein
MPASHYYQMNEIAELAFIKAPKSILDIGVGFGKYGVLLREYLDVWNERYSRDQWQTRIDGIEVFKEYISPLHKFIYNQIYFGNALEVLPKLEHRYDLILLIDVLEHFSHDQGLKLLEYCQQRAKSVIVSTPKRFLKQKDVFGNVFETHQSWWKESDFRLPGLFKKKFFVRNKISLICYAGEDVDFVKKELSKRRNILEKTFILLLTFWDYISQFLGRYAGTARALKE